MMRFILTLVLSAATSMAVAQLDYSTHDGSAPYVQPSETTVDGILDRYGSFKGAVLNMTREEWEIFRAWEAYDHSEAKRILKEHKDKWQAEHADEIADRKASRMLITTSGCDCWVEPDESYTQITEDDQFYLSGAGINVDYSTEPIPMGFDFEMYGQTFSEFYLNSKGSISFDDYTIDWTPEEFPFTTDEVYQIAGFWGDSDYRVSGEVYYKITQNEVFFNFVDVGYYNQGEDLFNSYQIIITSDDSDYLPGDANTQMCYLNMDWAHGDIGGSNGCCGNTPATVGMDTPGDTGPYLQFGRFNTLDDVYNGPAGSGDGYDDGVNWLDYRSFIMNSEGDTENLAPFPTANVGCDTLIMCLGNTYELDLGFLGPEPGQTITVTSTDLPGWDYTITEGDDVTTITGIFTAQASNVGFQEIVITATDDGSPVGETVNTIYIEVLDIELPTLTVDGNTAICAGGELELTATGDFDEIIWSNGTVGNTNTYTFGGTFFVTGYIDQCQVQEEFYVDQSPYFLPDVVVDPPAVCPGQTAIAVVDSLEQLEYASYQWDADWNGLGGEVVSYVGDAGAELTAGTYRLLVTDEDGCQGQRVFIIETVGSYIPEVTLDPFCDGIPENVGFEGGYSSPQEGALLIYMSSNEDSGWGGSYLELIINGEDSYILTSFDAFEQFDFDIVAGDEIEIIFYEDASIDSDVLSVSVYNCGFLNATIISDLSVGTIFSSASECEASPATGTWQCLSGPVPWSFSNTTEYDTEFFPSSYGLYEICFTEETCETDYCYDIEITEEPSVSLSVLDDLLCDGESETVFAEVEDIGGTAELNWSAPGEDGEASNDYSFSTTTTYNASIVVTNGCGSASASVPLYSQYTPDPSLEDASLCDGGEVYLDPTSPDTDDLNFEWFLDGDLIPGEIAEEYTAVSTGEYCVEVTNQCGSGEACANITIVGDIPPPLESMTIDCLGDGFASVVPDLPEGYTVVWPDGSTDLTWQVDDASIYDGTEICLDYTDPFECETNTVCSYLYIGLPPTIEPEPILVDDNGVDYWQWSNPFRLIEATEAGNSDGPHLTLCPEVEYEFDLNAQTWNGTDWVDGAGEYEWWVECPDTTIYFGDPEDAMTVISSMLNQNCWEYGIALVGSAINPCAVGGVREEWDVIVDYCELVVPNVFTPDYGDPLNEDFHIQGLEVYDNVRMRIYNRWGQLVYSDDNYRNESAWRPNNGETGTYWYTMSLPNGFDYNGHVTILRDN
jgi:gliding motility-associated-like protein